MRSISSVRRTPAWVQQHVPLDWYTRYGLRSDQTRLPKDASKREALARQIGADGYQLLDVGAGPPTSAPYSGTSRSGGAAADLAATILPLYRPRAGRAPLAHRGRATALSGAHHVALRPGGPLLQKRDTQWVGYKLHLTETCEPGQPDLITQVHHDARHHARLCHGAGDRPGFGRT